MQRSTIVDLASILLVKAGLLMHATPANSENLLNAHPDHTLMHDMHHMVWAIPLPGASRFEEDYRRRQVTVPVAC
jgi:hypothetical protein